MALAQSGSPISAPAAHPTDPDAAPCMLTLCRLEPTGPIQIPRAPQLQQFRFFTTRSRQSDGSERRLLHMGYFPSLGEAQKWALLMRPTYPDAVATLVPDALLQHPDSGVPTLAPVAAPSSAPTGPAVHLAPVAASLTDTQVLTVLETRSASPTQERRAKIVGAAIPLLKPEDTTTRRVIKEAVVQGAPVCFAVQLLWSPEPIDLRSVPTVSIFRAYTLYVTKGEREGRSWYCLRLGFFSDAISAKQVAYFVRSNFASVAVLPVTEQERAQANETSVAPTSLAGPFHQAESELPVSPAKLSSTNPPRAARKPGSTLAESLDMLAASEIWESEESHTETGVRHLNVQVQKTKSRRS